MAQQWPKAGLCAQAQATISGGQCVYVWAGE
eukprot:CAMPEP_0115867262 /NCGR_PEP_ID=MMETSP0287-20121206/20677_1 /TAXON_ID=412157 /ORGANISM="Chrysochromulina rotalis, Strain UIO044" /LENGTH=30 /DNA_ID= /DNA_START= /DNA_END= /DNA_ORIENTATION=